MSGGTDPAPTTRTAELGEHARLRALAAYDVIGAPPSDPMIRELTELCELAVAMVGAPTAVVNFLDDHMQHQVAAFGTDPTPCRRDESMCATTLAAGHSIMVDDASGDPRFARSPWVDGRLASIRFYCSTLLRNPAGHMIGTLCVFDEGPRTVSSETLRTLEILASKAIAMLELRLRTRQLEESNAELMRSQDRLAAFAGQVSHDLKAPITAILGFAELLGDLDTITGDVSAAAYVGRCESAGKRMLAMIEDLLAFARVGGTMSPRPIALDTIMPAVLDDLDAVLGDASVTWSGTDIAADEVQLRALLQNLIGNSISYRDSGPCVVQVHAERAGDATVLRVIDNGTGIAPERRADALRPLGRLRRDVPGAGLGLAVCVRVVAAHGGTLELDETPGGGLTVSARFPD